MKTIFREVLVRYRLYKQNDELLYNVVYDAFDLIVNVLAELRSPFKNFVSLWASQKDKRSVCISHSKCIIIKN